MALQIKAEHLMEQQFKDTVPSQPDLNKDGITIVTLKILYMTEKRKRKEGDCFAPINLTGSNITSPSVNNNLNIPTS